VWPKKPKKKCPAASEAGKYLPNAAMFARDTGGHLSPELIADMMEAIKWIHRVQ
jgi:hypothetical protein